MTGLQLEIHKNQRRAKSKRNQELSYNGIAKLLGISYPTAKRKVEKNDFTVEQGLTIMTLLFTEYTLELLEYLFTDKGDLWTSLY